MPEKSIQERAKETLTWIQRTQKTNGSGMVEFGKVPDQIALRFLLRKGDVFEPQQGMAKSSVEAEPKETERPTGFPDHSPWVWKTPKPKSKNDKPEPYEFLAYPDWGALPSTVAEALRGMGFSDAPYLYEGYSYRKMAGGSLRRQMIGTHSKEELLIELKQKENKSEKEWADFEEKLESKIEECRGKTKKFSEVDVSSGVVYYPKDGSYSFKDDE